MKQLKDIINNAGVIRIEGDTAVTVSGLHLDSREITEGSLFFAVPGTRVDGHLFIEQAVKNGAAVIVCSRWPEVLQKDVVYVQVEDPALATGVMASNYYDNPTEKIQLIGVTGTNGKTTIATLLYELFTGLGYETGLISTIKYLIGKKEIPATHTTPDAISLNRLLADMAEAGCDYAFMEVSSHAVDQKRIAGLNFRGAIFTNLTHDHLDYHKTFKEYLTAKKKLFDGLAKEAFALSNLDDKNGRVMLQNTRALKKTYSLRTMADFKGKIIESSLEGLYLQINGHEFYSLLTGEFNAYNLLAVYGSTVLLNQDSDTVLTVLSSLGAVEGRFQIIRSQTGITGIIDYAHTPDALENVLKTINSIRTNNETLITVVGAGGDRDKTKRPKMAHIASRMSNKVILTSDNPRSEDPEQIIKDMQEGIDPARRRAVLAITNREEAIKTAVMLARENDIILVAGKGHEKYQEIKGVRHPFDDMEIMKKLFETI